MSSPLATVTPEQIDRWSYRLVAAGLVAALALVLILVWMQPVWAIAVPGVIVGGSFVFLIARRPLLHLCVVLSGFVLTISYSEGVSISEVAYGVYYLLFLGGWYVYHLFLQREQLIESSEDRALVLFLAFATGSLAFTILFGGSFGQGFREWLPLTWFGFYFPIKKLCARDDRTPKALVLVFAWLALFVLVRNLFEYQQMLSSAEEAWRIMTGRVRMNERLLMLGAYGSLALFLYSSKRSAKALLLGTFLLFLGGIVIGRSRALWVAFALGLLAMFLFTDTRRKFKLILLGVGGLVGVLGVGMLLFDELFILIFQGLVDRFASLGTAITSDTSLVNRFYEWKAVVHWIKNSPILGHGFGVDYTYYSLVYEATAEKSHIHSTYLGLLYRHGIVGLLLMLYFWGRSLIRGVSLMYTPGLPPMHKAIVLTATVGLVALGLAATVESLLTVSDGVFIIMIPSALIAGLSSRHAKKSSSSTIHT